MRVKETNDDYRFFPDPDLAPFDLSDEFVEECRARIPELPDAKRERYQRQWSVPTYDAARIAGDPALARLFEAAVARAGVAAAPMVANVVINLVPGHARLNEAQVAGIAQLLAQDAVTFAQAREVLDAVDGTDDDPERVVDERGMRQINDADVLDAIVREVLARSEAQVRQYREGNRKVLGYLVGQCMRAAGGSGNPKAFNRLLSERLEALQ
jgi:aspartyl-tRNA(Asn)/glutamyl-tRNA(Gln) amidotransferase subunit B